MFLTDSLLLLLLLLFHLEETMSNTTISIVSFNQGEASYHPWNFQADPVMGGQSKGSYWVDTNEGVLSGTVRDVPSLSAPGFIKIQTPVSSKFPDARSCTHVKMEAKTVGTNVNYAGWRFGIGDSRPAEGRRHAYGGHKHTFRAPGNVYTNISMPLDEFSNYWNPATGDAIVTCKSDRQYCPSPVTLKELRTVSIWAEGVNGKVELWIRHIFMDGCSNSTSVDPGMSGGGGGGEHLHGQSVLAVVCSAVVTFLFL